MNCIAIIYTMHNHYEMCFALLEHCSKNTKKAAACIDPVKKVLIWCKDAEWCDLHDSNKPTLNYRLLDLILNGFIKAVCNTNIIVFW